MVPRTTLAYSTSSKRWSCTGTDASSAAGSSASAVRAGASSDAAWKASAASRLSSTASWSRRVASASSAGVGLRASLTALGLRLAHLGHVLLHRARDAHGPAGVAEVALAARRGSSAPRRTGTRAALGVEAVDGLDQAQVRNLQQVLEGLAGVAVAPGELRASGMKRSTSWSRAARSSNRCRRRKSRRSSAARTASFWVASTSLAGSDIRSRHDETGLPGFACLHSMKQGREDKGDLAAVLPSVLLGASPPGVRGKPRRSATGRRPARATRPFRRARRGRARRWPRRPR